MRKASMNWQNEVWAIRLPVSDLKGWMVKRVDVPPDGIAVAEMADGSVGLLDGARPAVGGWGYRLTHPRAPRIVAVGIIRTQSLQDSIRHTSVLTYDGKIAETDWPIRLEVSDPVTLYRHLVRPEEVVTRSRVLAMVASAAELKVRAQARQYVLNDLMARPEPVQAIQAALMPHLQYIAQSSGLRVQSAGPLTFLDMEEQAERTAKLHALQQRLREEELRDQMLQIRSEHQLREFVANIEHETQIRGLLRDDELLSIGQDLASNRLSPEQVAPILQQRIADQIRPPDEDVAVRTRQFAGRLAASANEASGSGADAKGETGREDDKGLRWLLGFLRNFGMVVFWGTTLVTVLWPHLFSDDKMPKIITAVAGFLTALAAFVGAYLVNGRIKEQRLARLAAKSAQVLSAEQRARADQLVRMSIAGLLRRSIDSVRAAKDTLLRQDIREIAIDLKQIENRLGTLAKQAEVMAPAFASIGDVNAAPPEQIVAVLDMEEKILGYAEMLQELSSQTREAALGSQESEIKPLTARMEGAILELKNLFEDRSRLLQSL